MQDDDKVQFEVSGVWQDPEKVDRRTKQKQRRKGSDRLQASDRRGNDRRNLVNEE